jgi:hypothetical protein
MNVTQSVDISADGRTTLDAPREIPAGQDIFTFSPQNTEKQRKLLAFRQLTREIVELNKTDPLPPSFDEILGLPFKLRELSGR